MMHVADGSKERWSWWMSLLVLCGLLGALAGLSFKTQNQIRRQDLPSGNYAGLAESYTVLRSALKKAMADRDRTIGALQLQVQKLQISDPSDSRQQKLLADNLKEANAFAGLTAVEGPGIVVTLNDSAHMTPGEAPAAIMPGLIHDTDINQTVNELKAAGAEALSVNDQRLVATSPIRCAGPTVLVNTVPQPPPYVIRAIGNPKTLLIALKLPGGIYEQIHGMDPAMMKMEISKHILIPGYSGPTQPKYAEPVPVPDANKTKK